MKRENYIFLLILRLIYENGITYNGEWYKGYKKVYGEEVNKKNNKVVNWYAGEWKNNNRTM